MNPATIRVWVPQGLIVRDPHTRQALVSPPEGLEVPRTTYYLRRIADGDLLTASPTQAASRRPAPRTPETNA